MFCFYWWSFVVIDNCIIVFKKINLVIISLINIRVWKYDYIFFIINYCGIIRVYGCFMVFGFYG